MIDSKCLCGLRKRPGCSTLVVPSSVKLVQNAFGCDQDHFPIVTAKVSSAQNDHFIHKAETRRLRNASVRCRHRQLLRRSRLSTLAEGRYRASISPGGETGTLDGRWLHAMFLEGFYPVYNACIRTQSNHAIMTECYVAHGQQSTRSALSASGAVELSECRMLPLMCSIEKCSSDRPLIQC